MLAPAAEPAAPTRRARLLAIARGLLAVGILGFLALRIRDSVPTLQSLDPTLEPGLLGGAALLTFLGLLGLPVTYALTLARLGLYRPVHRWFYGRVWLQAYFYRYFPGKVLLVAERIRLGRMAGISPTASVVLVVWESLFLLVGAGLVVVAALALGQRDGGGGRIPWLLAGSLGSAALLLAFPPMLRLAGRLPFLATRLKGLSELRLSTPAQLQIALCYAVIWVCLGGSFALLAGTLVPLPPGSLPTLVFWYVAAYVIGFVSSIAPGGLGVREGILVVGLTPLVGSGEAVALAVAGRLFVTVIELCCVGAAWLIPAPAPVETAP